MYAHRVATKPIRALIVWPDNTHEVRVINQDLPELAEIVGGHLERFSTEHADFWFDEEGKLKDCPVNRAATYLWWKLCPQMEGRDELRGAVYITGLEDGDGWSLPVIDEVVDLYQRIENVIRDEGLTGGPTPSGEPTP
jgi:hypothetical protein